MLAEQKAEADHIVLQKAAPAGDASTSTDSPVPALRGKAAPAFTLVNLEGKKVSLADYKGKPVLVNFWATWCAPCKLEMPWFEEFRTKYAAQGFEILGVSMDDETVGKDEIGKVAKKAGVTYPILLQDDKIGKQYGGVDYLPMSFYVGKDGVVVEETAGLADKDQVEAHIKRLLAAGGQ
ncbi:Peroxiredoxin [Granulicella rosea]|uniref:Peroxiredoxin n=2 Tax=Granulicella rosea TaxID=474952 RepID=A0A239IKQ8_9BACT|nr:Peroxiredoxin [Granulicella rosea]